MFTEGPLWTESRVNRILQPSRKSAIRLRNFSNLESGKATTRSKRRITAAFEGTGPKPRIPTRVVRRKSTAPLKLAKGVIIVPHKPEVVRFLPACPSIRARDRSRTRDIANDRL